MDAKLNIPDISLLLAKQCNISAAKAEAFSKLFFDIIIEGLDKDGLVKINGLGTFKIIDVASRGSVNINTGEKIEIKGHRKITFIPAETLKDKVNEAFAMFEPVEVTDDYTDDVCDTNEPNDSVADENENENVDEQTETAKVADTQETALADKPATQQHTVVDAETNRIDTVPPVNDRIDAVPPVNDSIDIVPPVNDSNEEKATVIAADTKDKADTEAKTNVVATPVDITKEQTPVRDDKKKKHTVIYSVSAVLIAAALFLFLFLLPKENNKRSTENVATATTKTVATTTKTVVEDKLKVQNETVDDTKPQEFILIDELKQIPLSQITLNDTLMYKSQGDMATHTVGVDETLTKIALKYYNDKKLWPYLVKHNNLGNHNQLEIGMKIRIPILIPVR